MKLTIQYIIALSALLCAVSGCKYLGFKSESLDTEASTNTKITNAENSMNFARIALLLAGLLSQYRE